jgi:hypothetical protein
MIQLPSGPFLASDLPAIGLSRWQLDELVATGAVRRVVRAVYVDAAVPDSIALRAQCAALVAPPHVVVSDRSAAWLHGVDTYDLAAHAVPPDLEVVSIGPHDRTRREGFLGGKRALAPEDLCEVCGVLTTTALRTACDLACLRGRSAALAVLDAFMRAHGLTRADFEAVLPRFRGRRGVRQLRELVRHAIADAESPGESWTRLAIIDAGLPCPRAQVWVTVPGYGRVRLDLAYAELKIAVEYDGEEFHGSEEDRARDTARREALRRLGWIVIVVTKSDFTGEPLVGWIAELRCALAERRPVATRRYSRGESVSVPRRRRTTATSRPN